MVQGNGPSSKVKVTSRRPSPLSGAGPSASSHAFFTLILEFMRGHGTGSGRSDASTGVAAESPGGDAARSAEAFPEAVGSYDGIERKLGETVKDEVRPSHEPRKRAAIGTKDLEKANPVIGKAIVEASLFGGQLVDRSHFFRSAGRASMRR